jgi:predicted metalloprotease with PDZ domain
MTRRSSCLLLILGSLILSSCVQCEEGQSDRNSEGSALNSQQENVPEGLYYRILTDHGLGMTVDESEGYTAAIVHVEPLSPAGKAGIAVGSLIVSVDGKQFGNTTELSEYTHSRDSLEFEILFEGKTSRHKLTKATYEYKAWFRKGSR